MIDNLKRLTVNVEQIAIYIKELKEQNRILKQEIERLKEENQMLVNELNK